MWRQEYDDLSSESKIVAPKLYLEVNCTMITIVISLSNFGDAVKYLRHLGNSSRAFSNYPGVIVLKFNSEGVPKRAYHGCTSYLKRLK